MQLLTAMLKRSMTPALALLFCVCNVLGQQSGGVLRGQVADQLGGLVPGATVTAVDAAGAEKRATTNEEGFFVISGLAPGTYTVLVVAKGFGLYENREVSITAGSNAPLDIKLEVQLKDEEVNTNATDGGVSVDPDSNTSALILRGEDLASFSDDPDQLAAELQALAGPSDGPNGSQFFVDGFSGGRIPPKASIREVRINQNPFTAEQDAIGFGRVEIFTKPGGGEVHGQVFGIFSDESLNARNPFASSKVPFQVRQYGGNVNGPINKKSSFFLDIEKRDIDENAVIRANILDSALNPVEFGQAIVTPQRRTNFSGRVDYQLSKDHTLIARYGLLHTSLVNQGVGGFSLPSVGLDTKLTEQTVQLTETAVLSQTVVNETRFQYLRSRNNRTGDSSTPTIDVQGAFVGGGAQTGLAFNDTDRYELQNNTTWAKGLHTFRFGGRLRVADISDISPTNFNGRYVFSSLEQYEQVLSGVPGVRPAQFVIATGNPQVDVRQVDLGAYFQGDWRVRQNFTLSYGVRFETQTNINDKVDIGPRLSFAWAPGGNASGGRPKTVIRGGIGIFYFRFGDDLTLRTDRFNGLNQQQFIFNNPDFYPNLPTPGMLNATTPQTVWRVADDLNSPYAINAAISVERQLPRRATIGITYLHETDRHLLRARNINAPLPGTFIPGVPNSGVRPFGDTGNIFLYESSGVGSGDAIYFNIRAPITSRISLFSLSRLFRETNNTEGPNDFPANSYDTRGEYGRATTDIRASAFIGSSIILPWKINLNTLIRVTAKTRFNIYTGVDSNGDAVFTERPAIATNLSKPGVIVTPYGAFDPNPDPGQEIIPRNFGVGPSTFFINMRVSRAFGFGPKNGNAAAGGGGSPGMRIMMGGPGGAGGQGPISSPGGGGGERPYNLTVSVQVQNLLNHANFGPFIGNLRSPLFGQANTLMGSPRRFDVQLRFSF